MYCATCGKELPSDGVSCSVCGAGRIDPRRGANSPDVTAILGSARDVLAEVSRDPIGGLPASFVRLGNQRALEVGVAFGLMGTVLVIFGVYMSVPAWARPADLWLKALLVAAAMFGALVGAALAARQVFGGAGNRDGDIFVSGVSLAPLAILAFLSGVIGVSNFELVGALAIFAMTWTVLLLHAGITRVSAVPESKGAYAVPLMLIATLWFTSVVFRGAL